MPQSSTGRKRLRKIITLKKGEESSDVTDENKSYAEGTKSADKTIIISVKKELDLSPYRYQGTISPKKKPQKFVLSIDKAQKETEDYSVSSSDTIITNAKQSDNTIAKSNSILQVPSYDITRSTLIESSRTALSATQQQGTEDKPCSNTVQNDTATSLRKRLTVQKSASPLKEGNVESNTDTISSLIDKAKPRDKRCRELKSLLNSQLESNDQNFTEESTVVSKLKDELIEAQKNEISLLQQLEKKDKEIKRLRREKGELEDNFESNLSKAMKRKEMELHEMMLKHEKIMTILIGKTKR